MSNEVALVEFIESNKEKILSRLPKLNEWLTPEIWMGFLLDLAKRRDLQDAYKDNPESVLKTFLTLADWGLKPDNEEAFINVRTIDDRKTAMPQWMYKGGIRRAVEIGAIAHAVADVIRAGDEYEEVTDHKGRHLKHKRDIRHKGRDIIAAYALFWLPNGLMDYELLDGEDIQACREASKRSMNGKTSPAWQNQPGEMAKKSALRRGLKRMQGKRDDRYAAMMAHQTPQEFDAETTAKDVGELTAAETPRAKVIVEHGIQVVASDFIVDEGKRDEADGEGTSLAPDFYHQPGAPVTTEHYPTAEEVLDAFKNYPNAAKAMEIIRSKVPDFGKRAGIASFTPQELQAVMKALQE